MVTAVENATAKAEMVEIEPKTQKEEKVNGTKPESANGEITNEKVNSKNGAKAAQEPKNENVKEEEVAAEKEGKGKVVTKDEAKEEDVAVEIEPKSGVSFPVKLDGGKQLNSVGLRKKNILGMGIKIYGFGIYADNEKLKELLNSKTGKAPAKPTKEMYQAAINSDAEMTVSLVIVYGGLTVDMVRKSFDENLGASIKKLTGQKNDELTNKLLGEVSDDIKLTPGCIIEIAWLPGYIIQMKVMDELVSEVESELLCKAYIHMYLGENVFDKDAKEKFGMSLVSLF